MDNKITLERIDKIIAAIEVQKKGMFFDVGFHRGSTRGRRAYTSYPDQGVSRGRIGLEGIRSW